jgi:cell wall-associated NlpC family hydrolase
MGSPNDSAVPTPERAASAEGSLPVTDRIRLALLILVVLTATTARVGGALGATSLAAKPATHAASHVSHATAIARKQANVVRYARSLVGVPYVYGGSSPRSGFDCSGLTRFVYAHFGIALPHYSGAQFGMGRRISRAGLRPGDLVFFQGLGHVGMYVGGGRFIHAPHSGARVQIDPMSGHGSYDGARRLLR